MIGVLATGAAAAGGFWFWHRGGEVDGSRRAVLLVSGDTAGWIVPCGCASNQSGGLLRRGTYLSTQARHAPVILADAGGAPGGTSAYQRLKFEAILAGEMAMGLAAHNLGKPEAELGAEYLRDVAKRTGVPFVSANLRDAGGRRVAEPLRIVDAGGRRVALAGVLSPRHAGDGLRIAEPRLALLDAVAAAAGQYDSLVVLAYLPEDELIQLAVSLPEADVVVGGPTGQNIPPRRVGPTLLTSATNKGKFLVELEVPEPGRGDPWTGRMVEMDGRLADSPQQVENLKRFRAELARLDLPADRTGFGLPLAAGAPETFRLAGSESCRECHTVDCRQWDDSRHAAAWREIETRGSHVDPYCQQCHTDGYGLPGGFVSVSRSAARTCVGCESCHGPSQAHVSDPRVRTPFAASDQCLRCHDRENSPSFVYAEYWPRVVHGAKITLNQTQPASAGSAEQ